MKVVRLWRGETRGETLGETGAGDGAKNGPHQAGDEDHVSWRVLLSTPSAHAACKAHACPNNSSTEMCPGTLQNCHALFEGEAKKG